MSNRKFLLVFATIISLATYGREWQQGHLIVLLTDIDGRPITDATVTVKATKGAIWGWGSDSEYNFFSASAGTNGIATVNFNMCMPDFNWSIKTASHYSKFYRPPCETFKCNVVESDYMNIDTNTVDGLAKWNELRKLDESETEEAVTNYLAKFEPKSVTITENTIFREVVLYPKRNPQPMYRNRRYDWLRLPNQGSTVVSNGVIYTTYPALNFDLKNGSFETASACDIGDEFDFRLERFNIESNGVRHCYGKIIFAPGCGAYRRKQTGDRSFPSTYAAEVNEIYVGNLNYHAVVNVSTGKTVEKSRFAESDEYLVLRTRMSVNANGTTNGWHYSKMLGPVEIGKRLVIDESIFNHRFNDPNLENDPDSNL